MKTVSMNIVMKTKSVLREKKKPCHVFQIENASVSNVNQDVVLRQMETHVLKSLMILMILNLILMILSLILMILSLILMVMMNMILIMESK